MVTSESSQSAATIEAWLVSQIARRAGISAAQIEIRRPFVDFGLDSVQAVSLTGDLEVWLNQSLSPTLVWDYPNIESLAAYLAGEVPITVSQPRAEVSERQSFETEPVAIVGLSCRLPGADSPEAFWELLRNGVDAISEVPAERWDVDGFYDADPATQGKMNTRWGGFLEGVDQFDPTFFGISPREATRMDPQQRLLLEVAWEALERAGQAPGKLAGSLTGVFIGISTTDYSWLQYSDPNRIDAYAGTGNAHSIAANRLSYLLDLRGPSVALDTACSSSLVAIHLACQSLQTGESNLALAGGVNLLLSPELTVTFSLARMMASDGRCKTFDARADGYVRGEGCGVVVLKRLSDALRDGDNILAVVRGSAVNHDGRSNGLTAPNGLSQQAVIRQALQNAGVAPAQLNYIEAHGTGTSLGDPIEIHSLRAVVEEDRSPDQSYLVGSVKTNIGHLESAAGVAGLMKVVLSLMHEEIPPHLHLEEVNPHISLDGSPLVITTESQAWPRGEMPRLAGVSSFGFGGTNAHIVLGEAPVTDGVAELTQDQVERPAHVLALSAKSEFAPAATRIFWQIPLIPWRILASRPTQDAHISITAWRSWLIPPRVCASDWMPSPQGSGLPGC
jgi:acyl transferase domain-containing protein/acyl carrier protein